VLGSRKLRHESKFMQTKYLHISAYPCDTCNGPVISAAFGTRETEISRESALSQAGAVCLSCGNKQSQVGHGDVARQFAPVEWAPRKDARKALTLKPS
jgi:hypothetical protein